MSASRGVNRRKLQAIARTCCDHVTTAALDRLVGRGPVSALSVKRLARRCSDHVAVDAMDALLSPRQP